MALTPDIIMFFEFIICSLNWQRDTASNSGYIYSVFFPGTYTGGYPNSIVALSMSFSTSFRIKTDSRHYCALWVCKIFRSPAPLLCITSYSLMAASSSKARARPIPRDLSSSEDSSQDLDEILTDSNIQPRQLSLLAPRLPRLHSIKGPFQLVLGRCVDEPNAQPHKEDRLQTH